MYLYNIHICVYSYMHEYTEKGAHLLDIEKFGHQKE